MMFLFSRPFLFEETGSGRRIVSWRVWLLIWLVPGMFALAAAGLAGWTGLRYLSTVPGEGEVVRVYSWPGETIFERGVTNYGPVFRYEFAPDEETEASTGMSSPAWNFEIGSRHAIRFDPRVKGNVMLAGWHNWFLAGMVALVAAMTALPAWWGHRRVRRWLHHGRHGRRGG